MPGERQIQALDLGVEVSLVCNFASVLRIATPVVCVGARVRVLRSLSGFFHPRLGGY